MSITKKDDHGNVIYKTDPSGNEIGITGKIIAGILLILVTIFTVIVIIAHWPDKMPPHEGTTVCTKYQYKWFAVNYLGENGESDDNSIFKIKTDSAHLKTDTTAEENSNTDKPKDTTTKESKQPDSPKTNTAKKPDSPSKKPVTIVTGCKKSCARTIDLNILILLLVALAGFLGNMIHIAASFTNFIGAGKFKRSWMLWYFVKPFTAAALAVGVYIIFRAGFLNSGEATASVNLYGVVAIAILAGLYTDMATEKLKEVFAVVFQSKTVRPDPLALPPIKITGVIPKVLPLNKETEIVLSGTGFDNRILKLSIDTKDITDVTIQPNALVFKYTATSAKPSLVIFNEKGVELAKFDLITAVLTTITAISPGNLVINTPTEIVLTGAGLDTATLIIKVADDVIPDAAITKTADTVKFNHTVTTAGNIAILVTDDKGNTLFSQSIPAA